VLFWIFLALVFNVGIYYFLGYQKALEFLGGYIIEKSLSVDNLFLFLVVFSNFDLSLKNQAKVLSYGIIGAIVLRLLFIMLGVAIVKTFEWILYIFGVILISSGIRMFKNDNDKEKFQENTLLKILGKFIPFTDNIEGDKFFVKKNKLIYATPLLAILIIIECSDIIFAIDSIPAIFSITTDPFIVYTSNIFAILGLRCLYFLLVKLQQVFKFVKYGVGVILIFTGYKLSVLYFGDKYAIDIITSLLIIFVILIVSIMASILIKGILYVKAIKK
jgi:tellurite resistance protein TerC